MAIGVSIERTRSERVFRGPWLTNPVSKRKMLYSHPSKRESAASETTTTTLLVPRHSLAPHHLHVEYNGSGSASGDQSPV